MKIIPFGCLTILLGFLVASSAPAQAQGMPRAARDTIHTLFNNHEKVTRTVEQTEKGYIATTESDDPKVAAALREHVKQMSSRLESGLMVRRWDPAFAEYVEHYGDIKHRFERTKKGVRMTVTGKTPAAIQVARNHAAVISDFVNDGWQAHDRSHPAVTETKQPAEAATNCCSRNPGGACCARQTGK